MFSFHPAGIRQIPNSKSIYLTFDDGPNLSCTPEVLKVLDKNSVKATFFVVVEQAKKNSSILREAQSAGHKIGNHSRDHLYSAFFRSDRVIRQWVKQAEDELSNLLGEKSVGFRPPAGVVTPPLVKVLKELDVPLYLWKHRFFDSQFTWRPWMANASVKTLKSGDIILLHDAQKSSRLPVFLQTLDLYCQLVKNKGYTLYHL